MENRWPHYDGRVPGATPPVGAGVLRGRRVLVTGSGGFIGTHLVRRLVDLGAETHAVSRRVGRREAGWNVLRADLHDPVATADVVRAVHPELVFHLAGKVSGSRDVRAVLPTLAGNLQSTANLLTAAIEIGLPRVVLAGSMEEPEPGEVRSSASSPYAVSKWAAAAYAQLFHGLWCLPTVVLRIAMAYGPAQPDERKLVPYVVNSLLAGRAPELTSGTREIDWVYVDDVVDAFVAAACVPAAAGRTFDIGSGRPVDIRRTVEMLRQVVGTDVLPRYGTIEDRRLDTARIADIRDATELLGWRAVVGLQDGLSRTVEWYRNQPGGSPG